MNIATILDPHPADKVALISRGRPSTYGELRAQVDALRGGLAELGIGRGDRVGMLCANNRYFAVSFLAITGLGAIAVPLNPSSPALEIEPELAGVGARAVIVGPIAREAWAHVDRRAIPSLETVVATEGHRIEGAVTFEDLLTHEPVPVTDLDPDDVAVLLYTSGTAGLPRAAMLSQGNLAFNMAANDRLPADTRVGPGDLVYCVIPLHHVFGLVVGMMSALAAGASVLLVQRFDPATALESIMERRVTVVPGAPPMWLAWAQFGQAPPTAFDSVRVAITGADKMPEDAIVDLRDRFGLVLREGYGLTEASPVVTSSLGVHPRPGSIGKPVAGVQVRLVDGDGDDVPPGDAGEVWVKGPNVFQGYWGDEEATARALTDDGWLRTGDIAIADDDGYLYIVDRAKDLIIVSGFNVFPAEVEDVILEFPGVEECAVVGVPHPYTGEAIKAYVVLAPGVDVDEDEVIAHCADYLARYKCPTKVMVVDELPKGVGGKLLRRALR